MKYRHLGKAGIQVSELSLGSWVTYGSQVDIKAAVKMMGVAYDAGVNFFDNAEAYARGESEQVMGAALKQLGWQRGSYLISTKLYWGLHEGPNQQNTLNRKYLIEAINASLKRLDLEYVDLLFCHRPDPTTPIEETVWAMHNIIEWGKALYWGTSEWSPAEIVTAIDIAETHHLHKPIMEQSQYNLFERQRFSPEYVEMYKEYGYGSTIWSPLASGLLTGKYKDGIPKDSRGGLDGYEWLRESLTDKKKLASVAALEPLAKNMGANLAQFALAWCLQNPYVNTVICGASRLEQVQENLKAIEFTNKFTPEVMTQIDEIFGNRYIGAIPVKSLN